MCLAKHIENPIGKHSNLAMDVDIVYAHLWRIYQWVLCMWVSTVFLVGYCVIFQLVFIILTSGILNVELHLKRSNFFKLAWLHNDKIINMSYNIILDMYWCKIVYKFYRQFEVGEGLHLFVMTFEVLNCSLDDCFNPDSVI